MKTTRTTLRRQQSLNIVRTSSQRPARQDELLTAHRELDVLEPPAEYAGARVSASTAEHHGDRDAKRSGCSRRRSRRNLRRGSGSLRSPRGYLSPRAQGQPAQPCDRGPQWTRLRRYAPTKLLGTAASVFS